MDEFRHNEIEKIREEAFLLAHRLHHSTQKLSAALAAASYCPVKESSMPSPNDAGNPLQPLIDQVTAAIGVEQSAVTYINGVPGLIATAVQQALAGGVTAAQLAPFTDLMAQLQAKGGEITGAITAAPVEPPPVSPPTP